MTDPAICPKCLKVVDPAPKRLRTCPHCGMATLVRLDPSLLLDPQELLDQQYQAQRKEAATERFRQRRVRTEKELKEARSSGIVGGFELEFSRDYCQICQAALFQFKKFPLKGCTIEQLPPYQDCELEGGCHGTVKPYLDHDVIRPHKAIPAAWEPWRYWRSS
jgi:hypothetical protein